MVKFFRIGDLVTTRTHYSNGIAHYVYCKIINIVEENTSKSYNSYNVITGRGDMNSEVFFHLKPIANEKYLSTNTPKNKNGIYIHHAKDCIPIDIDSEIKEIKTKINFFNKKINFLNKNRNRIDKLNEILN